MKDDHIPSVALPHYSNNVRDSIILIESCEHSLFDHIDTSNNPHNSWNASFSSKCGEVEFAIMNLPNSSSCLSGNIKDEISHFLSSPLYGSSYHEDSPIGNLDFYDHGCRDLFIDSSGHDAYFSTNNFSKPPIYDDLPFDEVELTQVVGHFTSS